MTQSRRRHERIEARASDIYHPTYRCVDISESGMKLTSRESVHTGQIIEIELRALKPAVKLTCEIMWCRKPTSVYESGFHLGVRFTKISITDQLRIRELIDKRSALLEQSLPGGSSTGDLPAREFDALSKLLRGKGVAEQDIKNLATAIKADGKVGKPGNLGTQVSNWMGNMISKSATGEWNVDAGTAVKLLNDALAAYYKR